MPNDKKLKSSVFWINQTILIIFVFFSSKQYFFWLDFGPRLTPASQPRWIHPTIFIFFLKPSLSWLMHDQLTQLNPILRGSDTWSVTSSWIGNLFGFFSFSQVSNQPQAPHENFYQGDIEEVNFLELIGINYNQLYLFDEIVYTAWGISG